jgi:hypothetical protein
MAECASRCVYGIKMWWKLCAARTCMTKLLTDFTSLHGNKTITSRWALDESGRSNIWLCCPGAQITASGKQGACEWLRLFDLCAVLAKLSHYTPLRCDTLHTYSRCMPGLKPEIGHRLLSHWLPDHHSD